MRFELWGMRYAVCVMWCGGEECGLGYEVCVLSYGF